MKNPLYVPGLKPGIHRIGQGSERKIKLRDIVSTQGTVSEKKIKKLQRFTKNMPGTVVVSHRGHGKYSILDGNHRVNAALRQGKRVIDVRVQKLSAKGRPILFTAASSMMRELLGAGYKIERGAANASSQLSGNIMKIRRGAPLSDFWHESGHALDMHGTPDGLKRATAYADAQAAQKTTGAAPDLAYRKQTRDLERRANQTAEQAMTDRGATPEYVQKYRDEVAPHLNYYRKTNSVAESPLPKIEPTGNPGTTQPSSQPSAPSEPRPIKRNFGGSMAIGAGAIGVGALGVAAASQGPADDYRKRQQLSSRQPLIQFMKMPPKGYVIPPRVTVDSIGEGFAGVYVPPEKARAHSDVITSVLKSNNYQDERINRILERSKEAGLIGRNRGRGPLARINSRHEIIHSGQWQKSGYPKTKLGVLASEAGAYGGSLFGKYGKASGLSFTQRLKDFVKGTMHSSRVGIKAHGITKLFSSLSPLIQFMHCTAEAAPRVDLKRKIVKKRINTDPIRRLSSSLDGILNFTTGKYMNKFLPGTMWGEDEQHVTTTGRVQTKPTIAKQIYKAAIEQRNPVTKTTVVNHAVAKDHPDRYIVKKESPVRVTNGRKTIADASAPGGERNIKASDLLNTEGYRNAKMEQMKHTHAEQIQSGYHPHDLEGKGLTGAQQEILQRGLAGAKTPEQVGAVNKAARKVRSSLIPGDVKPEMIKVRSAIARDVEINRRLVHAIKKQPWAAGAFGQEKNVSYISDEARKNHIGEREKAILSDARANFDEHLAGENVRRKMLGARVHEHVFKRAQHAMVAQEHGADWKTKLTQREQAKALESKLGPARKLTESIKSNVAPEAILDKTTGAVIEHPHGTLAALIGEKPETMEKFRQRYNSLASSDFKTNRKVENDIIKSGKIFDNSKVFTAPEAVKTDLKKFPTLKKIGIAGAVLGGGALAYHLYNKRKKKEEPEPQKMLMSRRGRIIQFGKKIPKIQNITKFPAVSPTTDKDLSDLAQRLTNNKLGVTAANEAKFGGGKPGGPDKPASQWDQVEAAQDVSPEASDIVGSVKKRIEKLKAKPGGMKGATAESVLGKKTVKDLSPSAIERVSNKLKTIPGVLSANRGKFSARADGRLVRNPIETWDVDAVRDQLATFKPSKAKTVTGKSANAAFSPAGSEMYQNTTVVPQEKTLATRKQAIAHIKRGRTLRVAELIQQRNAARGYEVKTGFKPDDVIAKARSEAIAAQGAAQEAKIRADQEIAHNQNANHEALKNQASSMREAREKALAGQASGHKKAIEDTKSAGWRNTAIGTGVGLIGGALVAGNASRQTYQPKKQLHQPERKLLMSSRRKIIRFERNDDVRKKSTLGHDIATGALEGGIVGPFTEPFYSKLREGKWGARGGTWVSNVMPGGPLSKKGWAKFGKNAVIGAGLGAASTAIVGAGVNVMDKKRRERLKKEGKAILFKAVTPSPRGAIARDKYDNAVFDQDENKAERNYKRAALASGGLAILLRGKRTRLGTFLAGAGAGIGAQAVTRSVTSASKDQFGDRSHLAKRIDRLPWQVPALIAGGIIGKRAWKAGALKMNSKGKLIRFGYYSEDDMDSALRAQKDDDRLWRKANSQTNKVVQGAKRGTRLTQDLIRAVKGQKNLDSRGRERKREWEKPWVRTAVTGTLMAGTAYGFHKIIKHSGPGSSLGQMKELYHQGVYHDAARAKVPGFAKVHDWVKGFKKKGTDEAASVAENSGVIGKINKWAVKAAGRTGSKPAVTHANIKTAASAEGAPSAPAVDMAKETIKKEQEQLRKLREHQEKGATFSSKSKLIRFRSEDDHASLDDYAEEHGKKSKKYRDAHEKWLRLQPGKTQRERRDATFSETKSGQQLIYRGKMAAALLGGALGARMLGKRMDAGNILASGVTKAPRRILSEKYGESIAASSRDPFITLNSRLTRLLQFEDDGDLKKKAKRGLNIAEAAVTAGLGAYGLMRRRAPLPKGASQSVRKIREAAEKHGFVRVEHQDRVSGRPLSEGPTVFQKIKTALLHPADRHEHLVEGARYTPRKRTKEAVFDPEDSSRLRSDTSIGENRRLTRAIDRSKLDEYKIATQMGIKMPHTAALTSAASLKKGYIAKSATGSASRIVVTPKMIAEHDPAHPDLVQYKKFRKITRKAVKDPNVLAATLNHHPGYGRWMAEQVIEKPHKFVQQKAIKIASEHRVHTIGGESIGITSGRHGVMRGIADSATGRNRQAEKAANEILKKAKPKLKGTMMAMDLAKDTKGKWHVIETNPGPQSGFLTPSNKLDVRGPHQLYKLVTGRYSVGASAAAAVGTAAGAGAIEARLTRDNKRKPRAVAAA